MPQPPNWRAWVFLFVWPIAFDPSSMGGPTGNICYRRHGSQVHLGTQAPPLQQSSDTRGGHVEDHHTILDTKKIKITMSDSQEGPIPQNIYHFTQ
jgi:hypothetical protein